MDDLTEGEAIAAQYKQFERATQNPIAFFEDRENWPAKLYEWTLNETTRRYARRAYRSTIRSREAGDKSGLVYASLWPLPVGVESLKVDVREVPEHVTEQYYGLTTALSDAMPFEGMERAAWILDTRVKETKVEAFGLVRIENTDPEIEDVIIDEMKFRVTGSEESSAIVRTLRDDIAKWWKSLGGQRIIKMGRPFNTGFFATADEFHQAYRDAMAELKRQNIRPTAALIADKLFIGTRTYHDYKFRWGVG